MIYFLKGYSMGRISETVKDKIREERTKGISLRKIGDKFNVHHSTVLTICKGIKVPTTSLKEFNPSAPMVRSDALKFIQKKKKKGFTTDQLAEKLDATLENARKVIQYLSHHDGYNILNQRQDHWSLVTELPLEKPLELSRLTGKEYAFGIVSDTHLNNKSERLDVLEAAYDEFARQGITDVFHAGNIIDGEFRFNKYEIKNWGIHNQAQYVADVYPQRSGITTHFITGTCHEGWYQDSSGLKVGWYIQKVCEDAGRTDMIHIGHIERDIVLKQKIGDTKIRIMHPGGGCAYAQSYPGQKMVESFQGGEKPHMLILGHYHKFNVNYAREITTIIAGCLQDQTGFMRKNKLAAHVGFIIARIGARIDGTIGRSSVSWYPFYDRKYHQKLNSYLI